MENENKNTAKGANLSILIDSVSNLQDLCLEKGLLTRSYSEEQLNVLSKSDLHLLKKHYHELLYAPPSKD